MYSNLKWAFSIFTVAIFPSHFQSLPIPFWNQAGIKARSQLKSTFMFVTVVCCYSRRKHILSRIQVQRSMTPKRKRSPLARLSWRRAQGRTAGVMSCKVLSHHVSCKFMLSSKRNILKGECFAPLCPESIRAVIQVLTTSSYEGHIGNGIRGQQVTERK